MNSFKTAAGTNKETDKGQTNTKPTQRDQREQNNNQQRKKQLNQQKDPGSTAQTGKEKREKSIQQKESQKGKRRKHKIGRIKKKPLSQRNLQRAFRLSVGQKNITRALAQQKTQAHQRKPFQRKKRGNKGK